MLQVIARLARSLRSSVPSRKKGKSREKASMAQIVPCDSSEEEVVDWAVICPATEARMRFMCLTLEEIDFPLSELGDDINELLAEFESETYNDIDDASTAAPLSERDSLVSEDDE
eukprot:TRINITY_DN72802_c0_g1_i1.p2 TRINITY_DN72802_c0_g1~~TRINITY_DN72802_c0_g1_i1.p2  ORF type:complete len:134 (+),score=28.60 TRINITY_DN72802_c0_g1_i1:58-402(+)